MEATWTRSGHASAEACATCHIDQAVREGKWIPCHVLSLFSSPLHLPQENIFLWKILSEGGVECYRCPLPIRCASLSGMFWSYLRYLSSRQNGLLCVVCAILMWLTQAQLFFGYESLINLLHVYYMFGYLNSIYSLFRLVASRCFQRIVQLNSLQFSISQQNHVCFITLISGRVW